MSGEGTEKKIFVLIKPCISYRNNYSFRVFTSQHNMTSKKDLIKDFCTTLLQFFEALSDTFDNCPACKNIVEIYHTYKKKNPSFGLNTITSYHKAMSKYYNKDLNDYVHELAKLPLVSTLEITDKWKVSDAETRDAMAEYVNALNDKAKMFHLLDAVPDSLMGKVETIQSKISDKLKKNDKGEVDLDSISLGDLVRTVQSEIGDPSKLNINQGDLMSMASTLMSTMGQQAPGAGAGAGGGLDVASLMGMLSQFKK